MKGAAPRVSKGHLPRQTCFSLCPFGASVLFVVNGLNDHGLSLTWARDLLDICFGCLALISGSFLAAKMRHALRPGAVGRRSQVGTL